jgi:subtilase family serine protease
MKAVIGVVALLVVATLAQESVLFTRTVVPKGWTRGGFAPKDAHMQFVVALKQRNLEAAEKLALAMSTPGSPTYQEFMGINEILDLVAPEHSHTDEVIKFFKTAGVTHIKNARDALECKTTVGVLETALKAKFYVFRHTDGRSIIRHWGSISVPSHISHHIEFVEGLSGFPVPHLNVKLATPDTPATRKLLQAASSAIIPETLSTVYTIPMETNGAAPGTSVGVIEFQGQNYAPSDVVSFAQQVNIATTAVTAANTIGPNDPTNPQIEASLDIQMVQTVDNAGTPWFWLEDGQGWLYQFVFHYFQTKMVPQVASISYGWSESDQCDIDPNECQSLGVDSQQYVNRCTAEFMKIAMRGLTILASSGDSGANGRTDPDCQDPNLRPAYPASCPWLTAVGATQLNNPVSNLPNPPPVCNGQGYACASGGQEVAVSYDVANFASGGGFSNYHPTATWQQAAVKNYFSVATNLPPTGYYNTTGRGYPDVAALGNAVLIYQGGIQPVGGTSCSSPIWAGVVGILNQAQIAKTGKPLGFLNPFLYKMAADCADCFTDITVGDNICTEDGCTSTCYGFTCSVGWDPITGWGSPNVQNIIAYINAQ